MVCTSFWTAGEAPYRLADRSINELLKDKFGATRNIDALVRHFQAAVDEYHKGEWEKSLAKGSKFLEAVLKALLAEANLSTPSGRHFKVDKAINDLAAVAGTVDDTIRLTIPRCCRFIFDVTSNRGGRHDPDEIDANEMDATAILGNCAWVLAEMVRYSQIQGDLIQTKSVVDGLMKRRYPFIEEIDGRVYVDLKTAKSARELGLLILWQMGTRRINRDELVQSIRRQRQNLSLANARVAVQRLRDVVDDDGTGMLRLRGAGFRQADEMIGRSHESSTKSAKRRSKRRSRSISDLFR
jgi:hypothetical protein